MGRLFPLVWLFLPLLCLDLFFRLPETKDKTYELGILFARRVNTREFGKHRVNTYAEDN